MPNESRVAINMPVLLLLAGVSLLTGIVFGLVPALQASKAGATDALKAGRSTGAGAHGGRTPQPAGRRRSGAVGGAAGQRRPDRAHVPRRCRASDSGMQRRSRAARQRAAAAGEVHDARAAQPLRAGAARARRRPAGRRGGDFGLPFGGPQTPFTIAGQDADESSGSASTSSARITCGRSASRCAAAGCSTRPRSGAAIASR